MPPVKGSKRMEHADGTITFELPGEDMQEDKQEVSKESEEQSFVVTASTMKDLIAEGVSEALKVAGVAPDADPRPITNDDLRASGAPLEGVQTQDSVDMLGLSTDGRTHGPGFIPGVPEWIANFDLQEHSQIIDEAVNEGYRVTLNGIEFKMEWWPTEWRTIGDREIEFIPKNKPNEPEGNCADLKERLRKTIPRYSATYILEHKEERTVGSEQKLQRLVAEYTRAGFQRNPGVPDHHAVKTMNTLRAQAGSMPSGEDLNIDLGHQSGADAVEGVRVR